MSFVKELLPGFATAPGTSHQPRGKSYRELVSFNNRVDESHKIRLHHPNRIPVIVEVSESSTDIPDLDKRKYLVPNNLTVGELVCVIRSRVKLGSESAVFAFVNNRVLCSSELMNIVYENNMSNDGFLYVLLISENTFGR